ncbi:MAG: ribosomal RNA small subunit methyltransferase A [Nitrospiraceae bacterium]|nr:ribosomal RNA small subunit methyltransferase A [Nitrospiraceae bacterium]
MPNPSPLPPPLKRLGQNFLIDPNIVRKIVALAGVTPQDNVLEIGPGRGALTEALAAAAARVVAIEIDPLLHQYLMARQAEWPNVELICADALEYPTATLPVGTIVVANLPYYISTPLLFMLLAQRNRFPRLVLMVQEEVADRLAAKPGEEAYGVLSVMAQYAAEITKAFRVSANCFRPRPDVGSAVVSLRVKEAGSLDCGNYADFNALVKAGFAHRRKTLVNSLRNEGYSQGTVVEALAEMDLQATVRAETLSVAQFVELARLLPAPTPRPCAAERQ